MTPRCTGGRRRLHSPQGCASRADAACAAVMNRRHPLVPQDNLLWEQLTARQHLSFYGRLKGLLVRAPGAGEGGGSCDGWSPHRHNPFPASLVPRTLHPRASRIGTRISHHACPQGTELDDAVDAALRSVNLFHGGVGDKQVKAYSGGMKRRLSVAISFIGSPAVVYLDEPSTVRRRGERHGMACMSVDARRQLTHPLLASRARAPGPGPSLSAHAVVHGQAVQAKVRHDSDDAQVRFLGEVWDPSRYQAGVPG